MLIVTNTLASLQVLYEPRDSKVENNSWVAAMQSKLVGDIASLQSKNFVLIFVALKELIFWVGFGNWCKQYKW